MIMVCKNKVHANRARPGKLKKIKPHCNRAPAERPMLCCLPLKQNDIEIGAREGIRTPLRPYRPANTSKKHTISRKGWNVPPWPRKNATPHHTHDLTSKIFITSSFALFTPSWIVSISSVTWDSNPNEMSAFISIFTFTANS